MKVNYDFNAETGISKAVMITELGTFVGEAYLAEEDRPNISRFAGCRIAEIRAAQKYYAAILRKLKAEAKGMKDICVALKDSMGKTNNCGLVAAIRIANKNYYSKLKDIKKLKDIIEEMNKTIPALIEERGKFLQKVANKRLENK